MKLKMMYHVSRNEIPLENWTLNLAESFVIIFAGVPLSSDIVFGRCITDFDVVILFLSILFSNWTEGTLLFSRWRQMMMNQGLRCRIMTAAFLSRFYWWFRWCIRVYSLLGRHSRTLTRNFFLWFRRYRLRSLSFSSNLSDSLIKSPFLWIPER